MTADTGKPDERGDCWLFHNRYGGLSIGFGWTARSAKADVLDAITEAFAGEGLSPAAAKRAAYSYHVRLVAGPLGRDEAEAAMKAWEQEDWEAALVHARPNVRRAYGLPSRPSPSLPL